MANTTNARYVALTTINGAANVFVQYIGEDRETVERKALEGIYAAMGHPAESIYADTMRKNLFVLSYSAAKRAYPGALKAFYEYEDESVRRGLA